MPLILMLALLASSDSDQQMLLERFRQEFVAIKPGKPPFPQSFRMGADTGPPSQRPAHKVRFNYCFAIAKYEVPQNLWEAVMGSNPSRWKGPRNSVEMLSLDEALEFCKKASQLMRAAKLISDQEEIRLPSEAEWEYVARGGTDSTYSFGDDVEDLDEHAWSTRNAAGNDPPVGAKKPNPWGLYDVHGYLWEWCADAAAPDYQGAPTTGSPRRQADRFQAGILRGGSWKDPAERLASRHRRMAPRNLRDDAVGLRCVLARIQPQKQQAPAAESSQ